MAYEVKTNFLDKTDNRKLYKKGDSYSHKDEDRIALLIKKGFLKKETEQPKTGEIKHTGGGWYELPNGEKVKGKKNAITALESGE